jgi:hypothetical protein
MKRCVRVAAVAVCLFAPLVASVALAQAPASPKPGPEVQKLQAFVGEWKFEGEQKPGAFGPAGKFSGTETCEWFAGGFQVVCHASSSGPTGRSTGQSIYAYDPETKEYTLYGIDSTGFSMFVKGTLSGNTWTFTWSGTVGGKPAKLRATMETSPQSLVGRTEASIGSGPMALVAELKETRVR